MKTVTKLLMGAAVLAGSVGAAHASNTPLPSTDNSNLMFFVNNEAGGTYTVVLSQVINGSTGYFTTADANSSTNATSVNTITGDTIFQYNLAADTALQSFISTSEANGDTMQWGIQDAAYTGTTPTARATQGNVLIVATVAPTGNPLGIGEVSAAGATPSGFNSDAGKINSKTLDTFGGTTAGVYGTSNSAGSTNINLYGISNAVVGNAIGSSSQLYGFTTNGTTGTGDAIAYDLGTASFDGSTLTFTGNTNGGGSPVPLPAAVWLFGSGLLGLLGIGRRRDGVATAA